MSLNWLFSDRSAKSKNSTPISLNNLRVASPCRVDWAQMSGDDRVRHCSECKLNVYNLSEMSRREAEELIVSREGRLCVRFYRRSDGTVITRDCPVGLRQLVRKVSRVAGTALSALMSVSFCAAQSTPKSDPQATTQNDQKKTGALMTVTDAQGAAVSGVQVSLVMKSTKKRFTVKTDSTGTAKLTDLGAGTYEVEIISPGFGDYRATIDVAQGRMIQINAKLVVDVELTGGLPVFEDSSLVNKTDSTLMNKTDSTLVNKTDGTVTHTFSGDLLKVGTPH